MLETETITFHAEVRGAWALRLAVVPLLLAGWLLRRAGAVVEVRSGRRLLSREFIRPKLEVRLKA